MATKRQIFYSFHYQPDVFRVQQIRNIGALEENAPASASAWEQVKAQGEAAIQHWIDTNMANRSCVVVLVGSETANRRWVKYEIKKAWNDGRGVVGIYIHNLKCPNNGMTTKGSNPFEQFTIGNNVKLSTVVKCYDPNALDAYGDIAKNLENWIEEAIKIRANN